MNELQVFTNDELNCSIRASYKDGKSLFGARDVCEAVTIKKYRDAIAKLDADERGSMIVDTPGGKQTIAAVTEAGLYILVLSSGKPSVKPFKRWVTHDVIPTIRKHGMYATDGMLENMLADPDVLIKALTGLKEERAGRLKAEQRIERQQPKVDFYNAVVSSTRVVSIRAVAKLLAIPKYGQNNLFEFLRDDKVFMDNNEPYQRYVDSNHFKLVERNWKHPRTGEIQIRMKTMAYQKGIDFIRKRLMAAGVITSDMGVVA